MFVLKAKNLTQIALLAALICVVAPWAFPIGAVPVTLATLAVSCAGLIGGVKNGTVATLVYIAVGLIGLPVFSGFRGGVYVLLDLTGGFILGYLPLCICSALLTARKCSFITALIGQLIGTALLYACGTAWYCAISHADILSALFVCVLPFLVVDIIKIIMLSLVAPRLLGVINIHRGDKA